PHPVDGQRETATELDGQDGEGDGDAEFAVEDVVQAAVAWIIVVLGVAAEAFLLEQKSPQSLQTLARIGKSGRFRTPGERVEPTKRGRRVEGRMLDLGDEQGAARQIDRRLG